MAQITILKCDVCGDEQRSDAKIYWAMVHSGRIILDFKKCPGVQSDLSKECLCVVCARKIANAIRSAVDEIKKGRGE